MTTAEGAASEPVPEQPQPANAQKPQPAPTAAPGPGTESRRTTAEAYSARELALITRENDGNLEFVYVRNDGSETSMIRLTALKNIFSKQLPNMPKEYIARLVYERRHRSCAIVVRGTVMGGITYRTFPGTASLQLGEIAFCAVAASEQVKGYGTRLMNWTKEYARTQDQLTHFLTCADNNAVGYFLKQGFTKEISLEKDRWTGYVKDYDGSQLMEFVIHPLIEYTRLPQMISAQRAALEGHLKTISNSHIVHAPLCTPGQPFEPVPVADIPGMREAGYTGMKPPPFQLLLNGTLQPPTHANLHTFMASTIAALITQEQTWPFLEAVSCADAPDYYDVVRDPIHVTAIRDRVASSRFYLTLDMFLADLRRVWANARIYNREDTVYYKYANHLESWVDTRVAAHVVH